MIYTPLLSDDVRTCSVFPPPLCTPVSCSVSPRVSRRCLGPRRKWCIEIRPWKSLVFTRFITLWYNRLLPHYFLPLSLCLSHTLLGRIKTHKLGHFVQVLQSISMLCFALSRGSFGNRAHTSVSHHSTSTDAYILEGFPHENIHTMTLNWFHSSPLTAYKEGWRESDVKPKLRSPPGGCVRNVS